LGWVDAWATKPSVYAVVARRKAARVPEKHVGGQSRHWTYARMRQQPVRVWPLSGLSLDFFVELLDPLLHLELWIGDAAEIRAKRVRKQKTDRQDAQHILRLLPENRFPQIGVPNGENRDLRQLLWHRHRMVQARTRIMNELQAVALNTGLRCNKRLWRERGREQLESFRLAPWASRRRRDLVESPRKRQVRGWRAGNKKPPR
jgi:transposase